MARNFTKRETLRGIGGIAGAGMIAAASQGLAMEPPVGDPRNRIARIAAWPLRVPCRIEAGSYARDITMGGTLVEVETQDGLLGHGFTSITNSEIVAAAVTVAAPQLAGWDALARDAVAEQLHRLLTPRGQTGHAQHAISAIDIALWDIAGKRLGLPVWRLLGGARTLVPSYTTCGMAFMERDELAAVARHMVGEGRRRLKMVVAAGRAERVDRGESVEGILAEDARRIRAVREAVGPDVELFIDGNHGLDEFETRRFLARIADCDIAFFEEPIAGNDVQRLADLRRSSPVPIAAGQNETHIRRFRDFLVHGAVDVLQFNVCICGGYTAAQGVAALGHAFGVPVDNGGGYAEYNMHLHAGVAHGGMVEWHLGAVALGRVLYDRMPEFEGDRLRLPENPGLGFSPLREAVEEYAVTG